jgi:hypothetical protein
MAALAVVGLIAWIDLVLSVIRPTIAAGLYPTSTYWVAPRLVWLGRSSELYDADAFGRAAIELGANFDLGLIPAAPPHILFILPFGLLPQSAAFALWTVLSVGALVTAMALLLWRLRAPSLVSLGVFAALPLFQPVRLNFSFGQAFTFLLLALTIAAVAGGASRRSAIVSGLGLAAAFVVKFWYGAAATAATLIAGRPRAAAVALSLIAVSALATLAVVGADDWRVWLETALAWRQRPETSVTAYQTLHSLFSHLFRYDATWNPAPAVGAPLIGEALWWISAAILGAISLLTLRRLAGAWSNDGRLETALLPIALTVPAAILVSPIAEDYHYVQTLLSFVVAGWAASRQPSRPLVTALLAGALILIGLPWPFANRAADGWWAVLFYPRVYGAFALWLSLVLLARSIPTGRGR